MVKSQAVWGHSKRFTGKSDCLLKNLKLGNSEMGLFAMRYKMTDGSKAEASIKSYALARNDQIIKPVDRKE